MEIVDLVVDTGSTNKAFANQWDRMQIDRWVWMMPPKLAEKVVDFQNFHEEAGHLREGVLRKVVVVVLVLLHQVVGVVLLL